MENLWIFVKSKKLIELINETGIGEIEVSSGDESVRISRTSEQQNAPASSVVYAPAPAPLAAAPVAAAAAPAAAAPAAPDGHEVKSPMVGTVYLASSPGAKPLVEVGQHVNEGDTLCLIEAMKMFNPIEADKAGVISARMIDNQAPVEFDQTLFIIDADG